MKRVDLEKLVQEISKLQKKQDRLFEDFCRKNPVNSEVRDYLFDIAYNDMHSLRDPKISEMLDLED